MTLLLSENVIIVPPVSTAPAAADRPLTGRGFHRIRVARVVEETEDARSFVLDVPDELRAGFSYRAGQFCTFRVHVDGTTHHRCYSMSSAPEVDPELTVTVKRVPGGAVSNWLIDRVAPGDELDVSPPAGVFQLTESDAPLVAFAAGSGITPIMSLLREALATTQRRVRLLYANRDRDATIFLDELDRLERAHVGRLVVQHRWDVEHGYVDAGAVTQFLVEEAGLGDEASGELYVCGPTPFMDVVEGALLEAGVPSSCIHIERFTPTSELLVPDSTEPGPLDGADAAGADAEVAGASDSTTVTIEVEGRSGTTEHRPGTTILQTARQLGLDPPYSCEAGNCATCMAKIVEGSVEMHVNDALTDAEVEEGWVLTCQSEPTSTTVHVVYGYD